MDAGEGDDVRCATANGQSIGLCAVTAWTSGYKVGGRAAGFSDKTAGNRDVGGIGGRITGSADSTGWKMKVLVACEFSGVVRDEFIRKGHEAVSCDLLPSESNAGPHIRGDVRDILGDGWDLMIAHPPCRHLAVSGARWFKGKQIEQAEALTFVRALLDAPIDRIALENPISIISSQICKPSQIIHPWMFGHGETKATCLWLKNLPMLRPTNIVAGRVHRVHRVPPSPDRWKIRSRTFQGIATAMADQWG